MDLTKIKKIYMIGIKGVGMTMLAEFLVAQGYEVSGSDTGESFITDSVLGKSNITVFDGFSETHLTNDFDLVVSSLAYSEETNVEIREAKRLNLKMTTYPELLASVFNTHFGIAVCGSHGKTTTTAWLAFVLWKAGLEPNAMVGAPVAQFSGSSLTGSSNYLIIEADEYKNKLQYLQPKIIVMNNIDYDHPDFFPDLDSYTKVFSDFITRLPKSGKLIVNYDDDIAKEISEKNCSGEVISYGIQNPANYVATNITAHEGKQFFNVSIQSKDTGEVIENETNDLGDFSIELAGNHNILNALAVICTSLELGVDLHLIRRYLGEFTGTARRMQVMGEFNNALIIDDYAHHPTEIMATLEAVTQKYADKKIRVVFHPHTFSRTKTLLAEFGQSFSKTSEVIVLNIYGSAREEQGGISGAEVAEEIKKNGVENAHFIPTLEGVEKYLRKTATAGEVIVLMGAGDVYKIGERLVQKYDK